MPGSVPGWLFLLFTLSLSVMNKGYIALIFSVLVVMMGCSCHRGDSRLAPFRWKAAGGQFDSLTVAFDYATWRGVRPDSLSVMADSALALARQDVENPLKLSRARFFRGVALFKSNRRDEADKELLAARNLIDSAEYPYDVSRIDFWLVDARKEKRSLEAYNRALEKIDLYDHVGDSALLAMQYGDLGLILKQCGDFNEAYNSLAKATSLFRHSGLHMQAQGNVINMASCLERMGRTGQAVATLRQLLKDSLIVSNPAASSVALYNLYVWDKDTAALRRAMSVILSHDIPMCRRLRGSVLADYSHELLKRGMTDSAYRYSVMAMENPYPSYMADSASVLLNHSRVLERRGDLSGALNALRKWEDISVRMADERDSEQIHALTTSRLVADARMQAELKHQQRKLFWVILSFSLLFILLLAAWSFRRYRLKQKARQYQSKIEKETLQNKIMSMHIASKDNDSFLYTFASINPNFTQRLKEVYPSLSAMDLKLAAFAALKLDIKQVARILGIKPESVKQSRWRLRRKLNLTPDQNLEDVLRPYLDEDPD